MSCLNIYQVVGLAKIPAKFMKEVTDVLAYPLSRITNVSVKVSLIPEECTIVNIKPLFEKGSKLILKTTNLFHFCLCCPMLLRIE